MLFYSIKQCNGSSFKIAKFSNPPLRGFSSGKKKQEWTNEEKLSQSRIRAKRTVCELAMANDFEWFVTITINKELHNRYNIANIMGKLSQFMRDTRKKAGYENLQYLLVPERHKFNPKYDTDEAAWHIHGFLSGIPESALSDFIPGLHPDRLCNKGYKNWELCMRKFGWTSLNRVRDHVSVAFYVCKYITKDLEKNVCFVGGHMYYPSRGLKRPVYLGYCYDQSDVLDRCIRKQTPFCDIGWLFDDISALFGVVDDWCVDPLFVIEEDHLVISPSEEYQQLLIADFDISKFKSPCGGLV